MQDYPLEQRTIGHLLADKADTIPDRTLLVWQGHRFSYRDVDAMTSRYANGFAAAGFRHGDHVAVLMANCAEFLWVVWGLGRIGVVAVPVNTAAKGEMLRYFVDQSDACCLVFDDEWTERVQAIAPQLGKVRRYYRRIDGTAGGPVTAATTEPATSAVQAPMAGQERIAGIDLLPLQALHTDDASRPPVDAVRHDDTHLIIYTSGTTGPSKGVLCPHSQGHAVGRALTLDFGYRPDDVLFTCLPLFHANAMWYSAYAAIWAQASLVVSPRFSASSFWQEIRASGATQFNALGAMTNILWKLPPGPHERDHRVRQCMMVPVPRDLYADIRQRWGLALTSVFGMSENFAFTRFLADDPPAKAGSAGRALDACELRIVDDDDHDLPAGQVGEILMDSLLPGAMMKGYYRMPDATAGAFLDGWFRTGDRGYLDADGYLYFVDRKKEAIRRRGENISAFEVESILARHPAISEVAAVPVASDMGEDDVMVYVALKPGESLTEKQLVLFAAEQMSYFMVPRYVAFIDSLPKTATEKIQKYKLKEDALARRDQLWDREREGIVIRR